jgi:hypothetical protein
MGLLYGDRSKQFVGNTDSDYAGDVNRRKSTSGSVFTFGGAAVACSSKVQTLVATSTCEAELIAASRAVKDALYFTKLMTDFRGSFQPITICVDNQTAIVLIRNLAAGAQNRTKNVDVCYNFARHRVAVGDVNVEGISTEEMVADVMTKQLSGPVFRGHRDKLGMCVSM